MQCFVSKPPCRWDWNWYLFLSWIVGVFFRYCFLLPARTLILLTGVSYVSLIFPSTLLLPSFVLSAASRVRLQRHCVQTLCSFFVYSWHGVVRVRGIIPRPRKELVFVANHTSMIDMILLTTFLPFAVVGQKHPGWVGWLQDSLLGCLGCIFFERKAAADRKMVSERLKDHVHSAASSETPLLIFPEGTCVNNEYCVMFKKGAFDLDASVAPIAIKYNKYFSDAFWNSRNQSFFWHLVSLMTSWATVVEITWLEPTQRADSESVLQFTERVKRAICKEAKLESVPWDGYLKYFKLSSKFASSQQEKIALWIKTRLNTD